jgi:transcription initiation factor TFIIF subunit alpha
LTKQEKYYSRKPWILEDETGEYQYQGQTEGSQTATATYYLLMMQQEKEFNAVPVGSWYSIYFPLYFYVVTLVIISKI